MSRPLTATSLHAPFFAMAPTPAPISAAVPLGHEHARHASRPCYSVMCCYQIVTRLLLQAMLMMQVHAYWMDAASCQVDSASIRHACSEAYCVQPTGMHRWGALPPYNLNAAHLPDLTLRLQGGFLTRRASRSTLSLRSRRAAPPLGAGAAGDVAPAVGAGRGSAKAASHQGYRACQSGAENTTACP